MHYINYKNSAKIALTFVVCNADDNSYKEIVWLLNLMNINDNRDPVKINEIFNKDGNFKQVKEEIGKAKLMRKAIGYVSFVRDKTLILFHIEYGLRCLPKKRVWRDSLSKNSVKWPSFDSKHGGDFTIFNLSRRLSTNRLQLHHRTITSRRFQRWKSRDADF